MRPDTNGSDLLAGRAVPDLIPEQLDRFTLSSLRARPTRRFNPRETLDILGAKHGKRAIAIDIGGDKLAAAHYRIHNHALTLTETLAFEQSQGGSGYVDVLEKLADLACRESLPVGISFAGATDKTRLLASQNLPILYMELRDRYDSDFAGLFSSVAVVNDAEAGIMAASLEASRRFPVKQHIIYVINGSGIGGAVLKDYVIFASEPGHIEIETALNRFDQSRPCGMLDAAYVCLETTAASKAGVEDIWRQRRGELRSGKEIAARYLSGDRLALDLYDNSTRVTAHVIMGMAKAFDLGSDQISVVGHGGIFQVPGYSERVQSILRNEYLPNSALLVTKDFSSNACLDGGAVAAVLT